MSKPVNGSDHQRFALITSLSAAFNLLVLIVICFVLIPRVDRSAATVDEVRDNLNTAAARTHGLLKNNHKELETNRSAIDKLNKLLDSAVKRAKKASPKEGK